MRFIMHSAAQWRRTYKYKLRRARRTHTAALARLIANSPATAARHAERRGAAREREARDETAADRDVIVQSRALKETAAR